MFHYQMKVDYMQKITFWELITSPNIKKICIPNIQRDYALGRRDRTFNRANFLVALKEACTDTENTLPLDFVYGVDNETMFIPLDGQQRLTILWLLHWYVAYKAEILSNPEIKEPLLKLFQKIRELEQQNEKKDNEIAQLKKKIEKLEKSDPEYKPKKKEVKSAGGCPTCQAEVKVTDLPFGKLRI